MPHCSKLAADEVATLRSEGIEPTFDEIIWLNELGLAVEEPDGEVCAALRGSPVRCGNVILHPFTVASLEWYFRVAANHYDTEAGTSLALAFALAHGDSPGVLRDLLTRRDIFNAVNEWKLTCSATLAELTAGVNRVCPKLSDPHNVSSDAKDTTFDQVIADLVVGSGLDDAYWMARPVSMLHHYTRAVIAQRGAGLASMPQQEHEEYKRRNLDLLKAVEAIRASRRPEPDEPFDERSVVQKASDVLREAVNG